MTSRRSAESGRQEAAPEGEVLTSARLLTQVSYHRKYYECSDDESAMAKKADALWGINVDVLLEFLLPQ